MSDRKTTPTISDTERIHCLRLFRSENIGAKTFSDLLGFYGTAEAAIEALPTLAASGGLGRPITICPKELAEKEWEITRRYGADIITQQDDNFPALLKHIKDCPPILTTFGNTSLLNQQSIAIVGARNASINGCKFAENLASELGKAGFIVVSGLARGVDTNVHKGSLETGTIAVLAGGIDYIYPRDNASLYRAISEQGLIITEMPFSLQPQARNFPRRNRIISGLSLGTIVVEATKSSGSLITARYALEHNREVFAVPGSPLDPRCQGPNSLIKQGAHLIESADDIINALEYVMQHKITSFSEPDAPEFGTPAMAFPQEAELKEARQLIISKLSAAPVPVDQLMSETNIAVNILSAVLLELEISRKIERSPGNKVSLVFENEEFYSAA